MHCCPTTNERAGAIPAAFRKLGKMTAEALQYEIDQLKSVSTRLDSSANQHLIVEKEIISISANILSNAVLLEVLLATRIKPA
jgi:hypothetical protein